jgi:hypothetical protein
MSNPSQSGPQHVWYEQKTYSNDTARWGVYQAGGVREAGTRWMAMGGYYSGMGRGMNHMPIMQQQHPTFVLQHTNHTPIMQQQYPTFVLQHTNNTPSLLMLSDGSEEEPMQ